MSVPLRLLYGLNADGRPKRISMFPPSYADRAREREARRHQRREVSTASEEVNFLSVSSPPSPPNIPARSLSPARRQREVRIEKGRIIMPRGKKATTGDVNGRSRHIHNGLTQDLGDDKLKSTSAQTEVTYCTHKCENHQRPADRPPTPQPEKGKKGPRKKQEEEKEPKGEKKAKNKKRK